MHYFLPYISYSSDGDIEKFAYDNCHFYGYCKYHNISRCT